MKAISVFAAVALLFPSTALAQLVPIPGDPELEPANEISVESCHTCVDATCPDAMLAAHQLDDAIEFEDDTSGAADAYVAIDQCVQAGWANTPLGTSCLEQGIYYCYCGDQTTTQCINNGPAGPCAAEIHAAFMVGLDFGELTGAALELAEMQYVAGHWTHTETNAGDAIAAMSCVGYCGYECGLVSLE